MQREKYDTVSNNSILRKILSMTTGYALIRKKSCEVITLFGKYIVIFIYHLLVCLSSISDTHC